ncbi:MAG: class I SAM-dependent methyltransferase [Bacteroidetes bacterium]|nr:class I SAM-dependent methyltransferase [Bacteroidota bacterium]
MNKEGFQPISNVGPDTPAGAIKFYGRLLVDFQTLSALPHLRSVVSHFRGRVLDVGCGQSPYRFLLDKGATQYQGIDIPEAMRFKYNNPDIVEFNGQDIPFADATFDGLICTEVLEHVQNYQHLIDEMYRVLKPGATGIITVPWSARYHYIPWDYFRYTPSSLQTMFGKFSEARIQNRGTDMTVVANKVIVMFVRNLLPAEKWRLIFAPIWLLFSPLAAFTTLMGHLSLLLGWGTDEDPLGYTIIVRR